jgi:hypothetical protein
MDEQDLIKFEVLREIYRLDEEFINALREFQLLNFCTVNDEECIPSEELRTLERVIRLHYDLQINMEGIDVIKRLLDRISEMDREIRVLKGR